MSLLAQHAAMLSGSGRTWNAAVAARAPWGWWRLDEEAFDAGAADASGNGNTASYVGSIESAAPVFGGSLRAVELSASTMVSLPAWTFDGETPFSLLLCFNTPSTNSLLQLISADGGSGRRWQWRLQSGMPSFTGFNPFAAGFVGTGDYRDGEPHMAGMVVDPTLGSGQVKLYMDDGLNAASGAAGSALPASGATSMSIGTRNSASFSEQFLGIVDEGILFPSALSAGDWASLWAARNS